MARYLVAGTAGFIGARVAAMLLESGHQVVGIDNLNDAYDVRLKEWRLEQLCREDCFTFHRVDICDRAALDRVLPAGEKFAAIVNLAARAGVRYSVENPWVYVDTNIGGVLNLLELARSRAIPKFVLASSSSVYGDCAALPYREDQPTDRPLSPYAASKKAAEGLCYSYHHLYGLDITVFRYFTVYGPAGRPDMAPFRFVQWIGEGRPVTVYGDGQQTRDFTYVDDIARGTIAGLCSLGYEVINLGCDTPIVLIEAIRLVEQLLGRPANLSFKPGHAADVRDTRADIGKAKRLLDWQPQVPFAEGFARLVDWYHAEQPWARQIDTGSS